MPPKQPSRKLTGAVPSPLRNERGVTLMVVLIMVVVMGLGAGMAGSTWSSLVQRSKEADLLFRGDQYRKAIESYYRGEHGGKKGEYPNTLEDLLEDPRTAETTRHIRKLYKDPMTGEDWELVRAGGTITGLPGSGGASGGIIGVRSTSTKRPFKQDGFDEDHQRFVGAQTYGEWEFTFRPKTTKGTQATQPTK